VILSIPWWPVTALSITISVEEAQQIEQEAEKSRARSGSCLQRTDRERLTMTTEIGIKALPSFTQPLSAVFWKTESD